jgi:hypothetical protein
MKDITFVLVWGQDPLRPKLWQAKHKNHEYNCVGYGKTEIDAILDLLLRTKLE